MGSRSSTGASLSPPNRPFFAQIDALEHRAETLAPAAWEMDVSRAMALANDAHTNVRGAGFGLSLNSVPLRLNLLVGHGPVFGDFNFE